MGVSLRGHLAGVEDGMAHFAADLAESVAFGDARSADLRGLIAASCARRGRRAPQMPPAPRFQAGPSTPVDLNDLGAVVLASGYRPDFASWVGFPEAFDDLGFPIQKDGSGTTVSGLHFMGVPFQRKRKSATLLGVAEDAAVLAETISRRERPGNARLLASNPTYSLEPRSIREPAMTSAFPDWGEFGVRIVRHGQLDANTPQTPGMHREAAVSRASVAAERIWAGTVVIQPGGKTGPHHHGELESVIYVLRGRARMR